MKKVFFISIFAALAVLILQSLWVNKVYQSYIEDKLKELEKAVESSIRKELDIRSKNTSPKQVEGANDSIIKKYVLNSAMLGDQFSPGNLFSGNIFVTVQQLEQDALINRGKYIDLEILDSIFRSELAETDILTIYKIQLLNEDSIPINQLGNLPVGSTGNAITPVYPIGTKGLQYIRVHAEIRKSEFLKQMVDILSVSALMILVVLLCIYYQLEFIKKKDKLFKQREAGVNGTIHDLKSPLNSIITMLTWLRNKTTDENVKSLYDNSLAQTRHLVSDIDSLLITARQDRQKLLLQKKDISLGNLVEQAIESVSIQFSQKPHTFLARFDKNIPIHTDALYMIHVLRNLFENALKYSNEGVEIEVTAYRSPGFTVISVADNGWGMEKRYLKKIFNQFYQIPYNEKQANPGYGIGLTYIKYIIENHGGHISVKSKAGEGSTFTLFIPNQEIKTR